MQSTAQQDIRTVFKGLYDLQLALDDLFSSDQGAIFITDIDDHFFPGKDKYCLVIEGKHIELIEQNLSQRSSLKWDVGTGTVYQDGVRQSPSMIMDMIQRIESIIEDLKAGKAHMYQNQI